MRVGGAALVFGTRPELVKLAPLIWALGPAARTIHTGQHRAEELVEIRADLELGPPDVQLAVAQMPRGRQIGEAVVAVTDALIEARPDLVIVQGDTNSTLAGALAASALELPLVHVEAGLRAFDRRLPEERNRVVVDHLADLACAPTAVASAHLLDEGFATDRIVVTGNTVVDAARRCLPSEEHRAEIRRSFGLDRDAYVLATFHRTENVDDPARLATIVETLGELPLPVVMAAHPRTVDRAGHHGIDLTHRSMRVVPPLGYRTFLALAADAALIVTDSGGVQEEASIVGRPVVVVRRSTERPEILGTVATLVDAGPAIASTVRAIVEDLPGIHRRLATTGCPYGDGHAATRIIAAITARLGSPDPDA